MLFRVVRYSKCQPRYSVRTFISSNGARTFSRIRGISCLLEIYILGITYKVTESPTSESAILGTNLAVDLLGRKLIRSTSCAVARYKPYGDRRYRRYR